MKLIERLLGPRVAGTRVVPISAKIVAVFAVLFLASNLSTNYINLSFNRGELLKLANRILVKDLKSLYAQANNQHQIYEFSRDLGGAVAAVEDAARRELAGEESFFAAVRPDGGFLMWASAHPRPEGGFSDAAALAAMTAASDEDTDGKLSFRLEGRQYFGMYKYNPRWDAYLLRAEELGEFYADTRRIFALVGGIIVILTLSCLVIGVLLLNRILSFVGRIANDLMRMQRDQRLSLIDLSDAPNDEISYLGASFNALSSTINNLLVIFRRFVTQDVAERAYAERSIRLEGTTKNLTILFTDIKSFTFMTETLGNDIINILNLHYDKAIRHIHAKQGIVGSIVGDALLAVFGTLPSPRGKAWQALEAAEKIQEVAAQLRAAMAAKAEELKREHGSLTEAEERVLKAVLLEVGVGIDGGEVFYGNIGSYERMTSTVIGDNVNAASRLEGLTRLYRVPVVCSESVKEEARKEGAPYAFVELDMVQVKGKLEGKRIYWPIPLDSSFPEEAVERFGRGLEAYYRGEWEAARAAWADCDLPMVPEFMSRTSGEKPADWNGIWSMKTK